MRETPRPRPELSRTADESPVMGRFHPAGILFWVFVVAFIALSAWFAFVVDDPYLLGTP